MEVEIECLDGVKATAIVTGLDFNKLEEQKLKPNSTLRLKFNIKLEVPVDFKDTRQVEIKSQTDVPGMIIKEAQSVQTDHCTRICGVNGVCPRNGNRIY